MEEKAFFTAKEREQLFALYKRLLQLSGDTLQKGDCHKLKIHLIKAVAEGNLPRNCFGMNPIIKDRCHRGRGNWDETGFHPGDHAARIGKEPFMHLSICTTGIRRGCSGDHTRSCENQ